MASHNFSRNGRVTTKTSVEDEIEHLRGLDLKGLRARWQSVLQKPAVPVVNQKRAYW
jgi:hypothetical protein